MVTATQLKRGTCILAAVVIGIQIAGAGEVPTIAPSPHKSALATKSSLATPLVYTGCCDASAGIALSTNLFVVASDEDNLLRVYRRDRGGAPVQTFDIGGFLGVERKQPESDLEGVARIGDVVYWITSHGRNRTGKERASRRRLIATTFTVAGDTVEWKPVGKPYEGLLEDLVNEPRLKPFDLASAAALAPKSPGALNIEGLCDTPDGQLLIGFRNPIPGGRALIVPLLNPTELIAGKPAQFGDPILLDLGGLGIRSLASRNGAFLIVAGPYDGKGRPQIYEWAGVNSSPRRVTQVDLRGTNPEGLVIYTDGAPNEFQLLNDDGTEKIGGVECKDLKDFATKRFRSFWIKL